MIFSYFYAIQKFEKINFCILIFLWVQKKPAIHDALHKAEMAMFGGIRDQWEIFSYFCDHKVGQIPRLGWIRVHLEQSVQDFYGQLKMQIFVN